MPNFTTYLKLTKPFQQEVYDVDVFNSNCDKVDNAYKKINDLLQAHKTQTDIDHPDGSVTTPKLRDKNVTTEKLADKAVTAAKLADDINMELDNSYVKKSGDTMTGALTFNTSSHIRIARKRGEGYHTISDGGLDSDGGGTNLDLGSVQNTRASNLCCFERPGWYGRGKSTEFRPLMTLKDISVTYGNIRDGATLPIPDGFNENECTWLLSMDQSNVDRYLWDINERGAYNMVNFECWREGRNVHVGTRFKGQDSLLKDNSYTGREGKETFIPGSANYICIAVKRSF